MKLSSPLLVLVLLFAGTEVHADLFTTRTSDSAIKMLRFPQSLAVIQSHSSGPRAAENPSSPLRAGGDNQLALQTESILNDPRALRILRKVDPARIAPASLEEGFHEAVTRSALEALGKKYDVDILLLFRREILGMTDTSLKVRTRGLVYLVRQKKIVTVPANETETPFTAEDMKEKISAMNEAALKKLAGAACKQILSHKFEKRQSAY